MAAENGSNLSSRQKLIIPIAAFTANGDVQGLAKALAAGLDGGLNINEIKEILTQMYAYTGFPRSLTALATFMNVAKERAKNGIKDEQGPDPRKLPTDADRNRIGTDIQTALVGQPVKGELFEFAPAIDQFLKEHLFCDIFYRGILNDQERELATIAALAALPAEAQLAAHLDISRNVGITPDQLKDYVIVMREEVGPGPSELAGKMVKANLEKNPPAGRGN